MIRIEFDKAQLNRWLSALAKVETSAKLWVEDRIQNKMAIDYYQLVVKNIVSQKFRWTVYSTDYRDWKAKSNYPGKGFWQLTKDLMGSLTTWKDGEGYRAGIPSGAMGGASWSPKSPKRSISMYGWYGEYGRKKQPARPLFEPTMDEYAADGHPKRGEEALVGIGRHWS